MATAKIPGLENLLAGYDVFGAFANVDSSRETLFQEGACKDFTFQADKGPVTYGKPPWVQHMRVFMTHSWFTTHHCYHEYKTSISARTRVEGGTAAFQGEAEAAFTSTEQMASSRAYSGYEDVTVSWELSMPNEPNLQPRLTSRAAADINNTSIQPAVLIAKYGTHYVRSLKVGGKLFRYTSTDTTKYKGSLTVEQAASLSYRTFTGQASAQEKSTYKTDMASYEQSSTTSAGSRGGSTEFANDILVGTYNDWCASVYANPVFIDFPDDALVGIWTLATDPGRQNAIKAEFDRMVQQKTCVYYGQEVYLELATNPIRYLTGGRQEANDQVRTWTKVDKDDTFRWIFSKEPKRPALVTQPTATSQVVNYGDTVYLNVRYHDRRWLTGARGSGNYEVYTKDPAAELDLMPYYQWQVMKDRTTTGTGPVPYEDAVNGKVFLKCLGKSSRLLTGAREGDNDRVFTKDGENGTLDAHYTWIIQRKVD